MFVGFCRVELALSAPENVHSHEVGKNIVKSVKFTQLPSQMEIGLAEKSTTGIELGVPITESSSTEKLGGFPL